MSEPATRGSFQSPSAAARCVSPPPLPRKRQRRRKPHRYRPGTKALREIRWQQRQTDLIIPRSCFKRLVYDILKDECDSRNYENGVSMFSRPAITALQEASEGRLVQLFKDAQIFAFHGSREGIAAKDILLAKEFPGKGV